MGNKDSKNSVPISTELTQKQIALLKANTTYTEQEIQQWHKSFIHECPTGRLDKKQFTEVYKQFCPAGDATSTCAYAFNAFDLNNDGSIDFNEFLFATAAANQGDLDDRLAYAFDVYDISDDGQIDEKELVDMIKAIYDLTGATDHSDKNDPKKRASEILSKLDSDGDKKLSRQEFIIGLKNDPVIRKLLVPYA